MEESEIRDWLNNKTHKVMEEFKTELMTRLEPIIKELVAKLRVKEQESKGSGIDQIKQMLEMGIINQPMYDIILPVLEKLDTEFEFKLEKDNQGESTKLS